MRNTISFLLLSLACILSPALALYNKQSDVQILTAKSFEKTIKSSDQITLVEFFAPWCGHCKNLAPIYNKVATTLKGMVNVAAIDCDDESNKSICGKYEIKGFPTLKVLRTKVNKSGGRIVSAEDYNGQRTVKAIAEYLTSIMPSTVQKINDGSLETFLAQGNETAKVVLFTKKGATPSIFKALSTSFGSFFIFAQIRDTQTASLEKFGIKDFPTLVLLPGGEDPPIVYQGEMKLQPLKSFLSTYATSKMSSAATSTDNHSAKDQTRANSESSIIPEEPGFKTLADTKDVENLLFGNTIKTAVVVPANVLADLSFKTQSRDLAYFQYSPDAGLELQKLLGVANNTMIFVNSRKSWFVVAPELPTSANAVLDFVDRVKQGEAGQKIKFSVSEHKTEL